MKINKSLFITFEGGEGAGKSSLLKSLSEALIKQGIKVTCTREPGGSELGEQIRSLLLQHKIGGISDRAELLLFLGSRAQHVDELIRPALEAGHVVLCDRFNDSTIAYQGFARKLEVSSVEELCKFASGGVSPDLTFLLDLEPAFGLKRIHSAKDRQGETDRIESEALAFHHLVRKGFLSLANKDPERIKILDASQPKKVVFEMAWELLLEKLKG